MDIRLFDYFLALCETGSESAAAHRCGVTQQGVSAAVRRLESELGAKLVEHGPSGVSPTRYGELFLDLSRDFSRSYSRFQTSLAAMKAHDANLIRVGFVAGFLGYIGEDAGGGLGCGAGVLAEDLSDFDQVAAGLLDGRFDLGVTPSPAGAGTVSHLLVDDPFFMWVPRCNALSRRTELSLSDLDGTRVCYLDMNERMSAYVVEAFRQSGTRVELVPVRETIRIYELARKGDALGLTARNHVSAVGSRDVLGIPVPELRLTYYASLPTDREVPPTAINYLEALRERCAPLRG